MAPQSAFSNLCRHNQNCTNSNSIGRTKGLHISSLGRAYTYFLVCLPCRSQNSYSIKSIIHHTVKYTRNQTFLRAKPAFVFFQNTGLISLLCAFLKYPTLFLGAWTGMLWLNLGGGWQIRFCLCFQLLDFAYGSISPLRWRRLDT